MKKFEYSLQKVLDLRNFELHQAEVELGKVNADIAQTHTQLNTIAIKRHTVIKETDSSKDLTMYTQTQAYFIFLDQKKEQCLEELARLELIAEEKRKRVREAMQKVKVLEKLKEKKRELWREERLKQEELAMDDVVTSQFKRTIF